MKPTHKKGVFDSKERFERWFKGVYEQNFERLYRYAYSITKDKQLAEDTVSEVFMGIWNKKPAYEDIKELQAYLHVSVKHQAIRIASRDPGKFTYADYDECLQISDTIDPESLLIGKELEKLVAGVLDSLSPHCQVVYDLSKNKGLTNQQIADELGVSKRTVESQLYTVIKKVKTGLAKHFTQHGKTYRFLTKAGTVMLSLASAEVLFL